MEQGDLAGALQTDRGSLVIAARLAKADPTNTGLQRDLSIATKVSATCRGRRAI